MQNEIQKLIKTLTKEYDRMTDAELVHCEDEMTTALASLEELDAKLSMFEKPYSTRMSDVEFDYKSSIGAI